jgi:putrescine aminotransferase
MNKIRKELFELDKKHYLHPTSGIKEQQINGPTLIVKEGKGIYLTDFNGKRYIDGLSSLWNVNIGHGHEEIGQVAKEQMGRLAFSSSFSGFSHEPAIRLSAKIASMTPGDLNVCFFTTGGSDANETAFKLVRHYYKLKGEKRYKIISRKFAYHGVVMGATSATGLQSFHDLASPLAPGFFHAAAPYCFHCEFNKEISNCNLDCALSIEHIINSEGEETVAAVIVEPLQGAGGVIIPPDGYLKKVRDICNKYGIIMIVDEVITGFGRTGRMFGVDHAGIVPDILVSAKGITSGYMPLGVMVLTENMHNELVEMSSPGVLAHGLTYSGHPTSCAVALKNIEILERENLVEKARDMGKILSAGLKTLAINYQIIGEIRSLGLIGAIEFAKRSEPNQEPLTKKVYQLAFNKGLITRAISFYGSDVIAFAPPLVINEEEINKIISILREAISEVNN